jgi:hypothetical protein
MKGLTIKDVTLCVLMGLCLILAILATAWFISETNDLPLESRDLRDQQ